MSGTGTLVKRHSLPSYFALSYAISWSGVLAVVGSGGLRSGHLEPTRGTLVWVAMLAGPSVAALFLTLQASGVAGLRELGRGMARWRVPLRWYATLLITPVIGSVIVGALSLAWSEFRPWMLVEPDRAVVLGVFTALLAGAAVEELGWTGYATPRVLATRQLLPGALVLGAAHGGWHFLADFSGRGEAAALLYSLRYLVFWIGGLVALRLLMLWVYEHTESLLLGQLIHGSYTATLFLLTPPAASAAQELLLWTLFTGVFAAVVVALVRPARPSVQ